MTLANHLRAQRGPHGRAALKHHRLAAKGDPIYRQRHYFWREVGGVLFGLGRFSYSARAYEKATRQEGESECTALRADALMFAGRYSEAHELFRTYVDANSEVDDAEWHLKSLALAEIIKFLDIEKQARNHFEAIR